MHRFSSAKKYSILTIVFLTAHKYNCHTYQLYSARGDCSTVRAYPRLRKTTLQWNLVQHVARTSAD